MGGGSLTKYQKTYDYYIEVYDADRNFLERVMQEIRTTLKVNAKIVSPKNCNYCKLRISDKELFMTISELIRKRLKSPTKAFIRGTIDAEGTVYAGKKVV